MLFDVFSATEVKEICKELSSSAEGDRYRLFLDYVKAEAEAESLIPSSKQAKNLRPYLEKAITKYKRPVHYQEINAVKGGEEYSGSTYAWCFAEAISKGEIIKRKIGRVNYYWIVK